MTFHGGRKRKLSDARDERHKSSDSEMIITLFYASLDRLEQRNYCVHSFPPVCLAANDVVDTVTGDYGVLNDEVYAYLSTVGLVCLRLYSTS